MILLRPTFNQVDFEREKQKLESQILQLNDDPSYLASSELNGIIYNNTPYQFPSYGIKEMLKDIVNNDIIDYYKNEYTPDGSTLIAVGDISENELKLHLTNSIGAWRNNKIGRASCRERV